MLFALVPVYERPFLRWATGVTMVASSRCSQLTGAKPTRTEHAPIVVSNYAVWEVGSNRETAISALRSGFRLEKIRS